MNGGNKKSLKKLVCTTARGDREMNRKLVTLFGFLVISILLYAPIAQAALTKVFYTDGVIEEGDNYDEVIVYDTPPSYTTVDMTGGFVYSGFTYDSSTLNVSEGMIDSLHTYESSTANIYDGYIGGFGLSLSVYDSSSVNIFGGFIGYEFSSSLFYIYNSGVVNIDMQDGWIGGFMCAFDSSTVNIYTGLLSTLGAFDSSTVNIYGGDIGSSWGFGVSPSATVNIYGYGFEYDPKWRWYEDDPVWGTGWVSKLTGFGFDETPIEITNIPDPFTSPNINLIPEPSTVMLIGLGALGLLRRHRRGAIYPE